MQRSCGRTRFGVLAEGNREVVPGEQGGRMVGRPVTKEHLGQGQLSTMRGHRF